MEKSPRILLVLAHPDRKSFGGALAGAYEEGLRDAGCRVETLHLNAVSFDAAPQGRPPPLEAELQAARELIRSSHHLVFVYPTWLGAMPARLKGFFERVLGDGFGSRFKPDSLFPERLLKGRSADVLVTMDTPPLLYRFLLGAPGHRLIRNGILSPTGIEPVRILSFGPLRSSTDHRRARWLEKARERARRVGRRLALEARPPSGAARGA